MIWFYVGALIVLMFAASTIVYFAHGEDEGDADEFDELEDLQQRVADLHSLEARHEALVARVQELEKALSAQAKKITNMSVARATGGGLRRSK